MFMHVIVYLYDYTIVTLITMVLDVFFLICILIFVFAWNYLHGILFDASLDFVTDDKDQINCNSSNNGCVAQMMMRRTKSCFCNQLGTIATRLFLKFKC